MPDLRDMGVDVESVLFGTYAVAKPGAGIIRQPAVGIVIFPEIPVFDEPFGSTRTLVDRNTIDDVDHPFQLVNTSGPGGALVLRVIAASLDNEWLLVQVPVRPNNSYAWVRGQDLDIGYTPQRIEINLTDGGELTFFDGDDVVLTTPIVHGKESRPTPTHVGFLQNGVLGERLSPAYGLAVLSIASFSEALGTFGGGGLPSNFLHGTNQPDLMGQRVSSGEIRMPNEALAQIIDEASPGTPVIIHQDGGRDFMLRQTPTPAATIPFPRATSSAAATTSLTAATRSVRDGTTGVLPQLWRRCSPGDSVPVSQLLCRTSGDIPSFPAGSDRNHVFAVARQEPNNCLLRPDLDFDATSVSSPADLPSGADCLIPVYDELGSNEPRVLTFENAIDGTTVPAPLYAETEFGQPLVLSVIELSPDGRWLRVRAPVLPHNQTVWVKGEDFALRSTPVRIEIDVGLEIGSGPRRGLMYVYDGDRELLSAEFVAGRESRPTTLTSTYIDQVIEGSTLAPVYGPFIFSTPSFSEALGTFGGGAAVPTQSIHGLSSKQWPMHAGSSGSMHTTDETAESLAGIDDILGARVIIYDSSDPTISLGAIEGQPLNPAQTISPDDVVSWDPLLHSFT